jgi:ATP-dependent helicase/nuclease subunit A
MTTADPQVLASNPKAVVFVTANAGSGKTSTLVKRVARLLLGGSAPDAILCVTYTKAAAAEMQRRLYEMLGDWAVMNDKALAETLAALDEREDDLSKARRLFARALETPGGLKIQTIHAFCEKLLRRFPLEAGVSPGFRVLEAQAAAEVSAQARDKVALVAEARPDELIGRAYAHFAVALSYGDFNDLFATFEAQRRTIADYHRACELRGGFEADVWARCGFPAPRPSADIEAEALSEIDWDGWRWAAEGLGRGSKTDQDIAAVMRATGPGAGFAEVWAPFSTKAGEPRARMATKSVDAAVAAWLVEEQIRLGDARAYAGAARTAEETIAALTLALAYGALYEGEKAAISGLDFGDLIERTHQLLTVRADAAWVLYKLDGGVDHVLLDEAQDTAPEQWEILRALTEEFFAGAGSPRKADVLRTVFAVGDEKQSIYSFQGAAPERLALETRWFKALTEGAGRGFREQPLLESWRSTAEVLGFVDAVFADPEAAEGLRPGGGGAPVTHRAMRGDPGAVELWPFEEDEPAQVVDPWLPVDAETRTRSANRELAERIARRIRAMVADGERVLVKGSQDTFRPVGYGDILILVRRRGALFHEIIRALKREGVAVGGADRLRLSDHVVFQDLMALGRFARFPEDDLTLAALLRSPFCDVDEQGLFDLAQPRQGRLWADLGRRAGERRAWAAAHRFLTWVLAEARTRSPFDFYGRALARLDEAGRSMRQRMLTRLGQEAADALDAFLAEALGAEDRQVRDLETFLAEMAATEIEVKREQEDTAGRDGGEVRVMTAHGAKGLEAPIVFLPDTTTKSAARGSPLMATGDGGFIWAPRKADDCEASAMARAVREKAARDESLRLLYVAMTRARDRLVVCGVATEPRYFNGSWADYVARAFERPEIAERTRDVMVDGMTVQRFGADPDTAPVTLAAERPADGLPAWTQALAAAPSPALRYAAPSTLAEDERGPSPSPLSERGGLGRFRRGLLIHRLLQLLPDIPPAGRAAAAASLLAREQDLTASQADEMAAAALGVLEDARFFAVFGPGSRAEAAIAGRAASLPPGLAISGRVDRLVVMPDKVLVVDYKTNRPAPDRIEDADPAYLTQMAVYAAVLAEVFPGRTIEAALVWTDGPALMPVPENIITERLALLAGAS